MNKTVNVQKAIKIAKQLKQRGKSIVLVGGCFDILHVGHIRFLKKAKEKRDVLFVLLESDKSCSRKGRGRPINSQKERAEVISSILPVDYVVNLKDKMKDADYDRIIEKLKPDILATTDRDPNIIHKKRQADQTGAKLIYVIERLPKYSSTEILKIK